MGMSNAYRDELPYESTLVCTDCQIFWGNDAKIIKKKRVFRNRETGELEEYASWRNPDESSHNVNCGTEENPQWVHVWSKKEHELAKDGGTARLRPHREEMGYSDDKQHFNISVNENH